MEGVLNFSLEFWNVVIPLVLVPVRFFLRVNFLVSIFFYCCCSTQHLYIYDCLCINGVLK